ncbi:MAG: hypothetical protein IT381_33080 [Deltaproteobacteria bacterium]|nr:hypothetical protein [Deltaproteobacteria bacterium]
MKLKHSFALGVLIIAFAAPTKVHAGASIFGFSIGDDTMTLGAILAQAIQQTKFLSDLAAFSKDVKESVAFVRDVYETGDDVIHGRWEELSQQFLMDVVMSDRNLAEIYRNSEDIISQRVGRSRSFRRLVDAGLGRLLFETFGPYPFGQHADQYALSDYHSMSLASIADDVVAASHERSRMITQAWNDCLGGLEECEFAAGKMNALQASILQQQLSLQSEQARAQATENAIRNAERKGRERELQFMQRDVVRGLSDFGVNSKTKLYREEDFQ